MSFPLDAQLPIICKVRKVPRAPVDLSPQSQTNKLHCREKEKNRDDQTTLVDLEAKMRR